jgi:hypothetical protein
MFPLSIPSIYIRIVEVLLIFIIVWDRWSIERFLASTNVTLALKIVVRKFIIMAGDLAVVHMISLVFLRWVVRVSLEWVRTLLITRHIISSGSLESTPWIIIFAPYICHYGVWIDLNVDAFDQLLLSEFKLSSLHDVSFLPLRGERFSQFFWNFVNFFV